MPLGFVADLYVVALLCRPWRITLRKFPLNGVAKSPVKTGGKTRDPLKSLVLGDSTALIFAGVGVLAGFPTVNGR